MAEIKDKLLQKKFVPSLQAKSPCTKKSIVLPRFPGQASNLDFESFPLLGESRYLCCDGHADLSAPVSGSKWSKGLTNALLTPPQMPALALSAPLLPEEMGGEDYFSISSTCLKVQENSRENTE